MFDYLRRFGRSAPEPSYEIVGCETRELQSDEGIKHAVFLAANLNFASALDNLIDDLVERFKLQRAISPTDTSVFLITIVGPCDRLTVAQRWRARVARDQVAAFWMSQMEKADVGVSLDKGASRSEFYSFMGLMPRRLRRYFRGASLC